MFRLHERMWYSNIAPILYIYLTYFDHSWLYMLIVGMDANFRLMSRLRSSLSKDPSLAPGWAYFVDYGLYADFVKEYVDMEEVSCLHCIFTLLLTI